MHICIVYDCLFPWTIGGAERWYRAFAERLVERGHRVTYLTLRQWDDGEAPLIPGVEVIAVGPRLALYVHGRRRIWPPLRFGVGVFWHLLRRGRVYDHVHLANFPFFSLLAAAAARPFGKYSLGVDWLEVWSRDYWREYLGWAGAIGLGVQRLCAAVPQRAFALSALHLRRLEALGRSGTLLPGAYAGGEKPSRPAGQPPYFVYLGRLIVEKRVDLLLEAFAIVLRTNPELRLRIFGEGPERERLAARLDELGLRNAVELRGFVAQEVADDAMGAALAVIQPSAREGYGLVVVEAAARGVPTIVVEAPDNAAVDLVDAGENGLVAAASPEALAKAILALADNNPAWRAGTRDWYARNSERLSLENSLTTVVTAIGG
jgi:glycosyltransferase involved in cell wall biosynthesis